MALVSPCPQVPPAWAAWWAPCGARGRAWGSGTVLWVYFIYIMYVTHWQCRGHAAVPTSPESPAATHAQGFPAGARVPTHRVTGRDEATHVARTVGDPGSAGTGAAHRNSAGAVHVLRPWGLHPEHPLRVPNVPPWAGVTGATGAHGVTPLRCHLGSHCLGVRGVTAPWGRGGGEHWYHGAETPAPVPHIAGGPTGVPVTPPHPMRPHPGCPFKLRLCPPGSIFSRGRGGSGGSAGGGGGRLQQPPSSCL